MREIILDTETTGLSPIGDRLVEIGAIELFNHIPTGRHFHTYLKPDVAMSPDAQQVHGLSPEFLADKPAFASVIDELVSFLGDAPIIAHNAGFDIGFVNAELQRASRTPISNDRVVDTLVLARRRHPAGPNSLDALCTRYNVDLSRRTVHGALLDASLLAEVYIELIGGRQASFGLDGAEEEVRVAAAAAGALPVLARVPRQGIGVTPAEIDAHAMLIEQLGAEPLWHSYLRQKPAAATA